MGCERTPASFRKSEPPAIGSRPLGVTMNRDPKQVLTEWLVLSAQGGSETALKELHDLWSADLRRLCFVRVGQADAAGEIVIRDCPRVNTPRRASVLSALGF